MDEERGPAPTEVRAPGAGRARHSEQPGFPGILWQRARAAALAVGVAHSSYWPTLSAVAFAGYQHSSFPVSSLPAGITLAALNSSRG